MIPGIQYGLGIENDQVIVRYSNTINGPVHKHPIKNKQEFIDFVVPRAKKAGAKNWADLIIVCSSSMDFPEDSTKKKATIRLARALRK